MSKHSMGLAGQAREELVKRFLERKTEQGHEGKPVFVQSAGSQAEVPENFHRLERHPGYEKLLVPQLAARRLGIANPFFRNIDSMAGATVSIDGRPCINFSSYNYLGLAGHPKVNKAAKDAIERYGTSVSASRLVAGERPVLRELEQALAEHYGVEDSVVMVSGHATNVTTIGYLFGPRDLVIHDALIHNSVLEGIRLAGAARRSFPHNDPAALDAILAEIRGQYERVLVCIEGHYSMDGDVPDLQRFVEIKNRHRAFLMVDEAHSLGVLGEKGGGLHEHCGVDGREVDIWMGTLSKTLAGCGGYIAGERALVEHLKYAAPGFVYSVGMAPPLAAASLAALRILHAEPERVARLRERAGQFLELARSQGVDTGLSQGYAIVPAIVGNSLKAAKLSNSLFQMGINVQPIIYPAVEERAARLRFFLSAQHTEEQVRAAVDALVGVLS